MSTCTIDAILCDEAILRAYTTYVLMSGVDFNVDPKHKILLRKKHHYHLIMTMFH